MRLWAPGDAPRSGADPSLDPKVARALERPLRATRVELVGPMQGMGYAERKWLLCLDGSQYVHSTELLYHLLLHADGQTTVEGIAEKVTRETGRPVSPDDIRWLVVNKLAGSGLIYWPAPQPGDSQAATAGAAPAGAIRKPQQLLAIKHKLPLLPYWLTAPATSVLKHLYWPPLIALVVIAAIAINVWLYRGADFANGVVTLFFQPELVLFLYAVDTVGRLWHELGHASALRRAGARYGNIGFALYVIFPVYYTDVTHAYRLNRWQRIRVDLGGIYFDLIGMIALYVAYRFTHYVPLLVLIALMGLGILRQFTPFMRFDGYYLIADIMGVTEPLALAVPFVRHHILRQREEPSRLPPLSRLATAVLAGYLVLIVAFLSRPFLIMSVAGGQILAALPQSGILVVSQFLFAWRNHDVVTQVAATLSLFFWALIPLGLCLFAWAMLRLLAKALILLARSGLGLLRRRLDLAEEPELAPAVAAVAPSPTPARLPVPLDGLGRPLLQRESAPVEELDQRIAAVGDDASREAAQDVARVYGRRLEQATSELGRLVALNDAVTRERDQLILRVRGLEETLARLTVDLRRVGNEMITAADAAERMNVTGAAQPADNQRSASGHGGSAGE